MIDHIGIILFVIYEKTSSTHYNTETQFLIRNLIRNAFDMHT